MNIHYIRQLLLIFLIANFITTYSQTNTFQDKFSKSFDFIIVPKTTIHFKEFYEITIRQSIDHSNPKKKFDQRIYIGFQDFNAPNVIATEGYAIDYASKPDYSNELSTELKANLIVIEHRFFGKSIPDSLDWNVLTVKQTAEDYHFIKTMLDTILKGKWISTGISKGGQAALSYKMYYAKDVAATVVYGAAVKNKQTVTSDTLLFNLSQTSCGKKLSELQYFLFKHKNILLPYFSEYTSQKKYDFKPLDNESLFDYLLLELPFSFWQNGNDCEIIPDTTATIDNLLSYLIKIVPPGFFTGVNKIRLEPAFYMFYHELGYYEYDIKPFKKYLKQKDYSNSYFAPQGVPIQFDNTYQKTLSEFIKNNSNIFFIYGQNDPWALQTIWKENIFIVKAGSHKSRIADLKAEQRINIFTKIKACIN
ncbi:MAG: hypothetical protein A3F72_18270 [Bacteroidetes bacterium RIFCSPLOWO2_12_FULL_35_15]|nr:MAG: hypothetical protein A3F72_18270 [Bacteroidetes bacterium RIFCSPLOWO2_12_FULL_35_15]